MQSKEKTLVMRVKNICLILVALLVSTAVYAQRRAEEPITDGGLPRKVENVTIKDLYGNPYISVIMHSETKESLYVEMNQILSLI